MDDRTAAGPPEDAGSEVSEGVEDRGLGNTLDGSRAGDGNAGRDSGPREDGARDEPAATRTTGAQQTGPSGDPA